MHIPFGWMQVAPFLVAVVDDEESVRRALGRLLVASGFDVQTYGSGQDFIAALARNAPQCVVLDLRMPRMSGFETQDAMIEARCFVPVVIITGDDSPEARQQRFNALFLLAHKTFILNDRAHYVLNHLQTGKK